MGDNFLKRIVTSFVLFSLVWWVTFFMPNWVFCMVAVFFIGVALYEFFSVIERMGIFVYKYFGITIGIIIPITIYLQYDTGIPSNLEPFFIVIACLLAFVLQFVRREYAKDHLISIACLLFALFYISWFFSFFVKIKFLKDGSKLAWFLILVTKTGDIGAYLIGKKFGKVPLIPRISPKKTKEGAIGGLVFSIIAAVLSRDYLISLPYQRLVSLGILLGVLGQLGDLAESLLKRDLDVKDAGDNLPGFGGVLDVIDSLLFTAPIFYFYLNIKLF